MIDGPSAGSATARSPTWWSSGRARRRTARSRGSSSRRARPATGDDDGGQGRGARDLAGGDHLDGVRVPDRARLPGAARSRTPAGCWSRRAATCAWGALGHAVAAYDTALTYAKQREQFGKPLVQLSDRPGPAGQDARRGHRHAALLHADRSSGGGRAGSQTRSRGWPSSTTPARRGW